MGNSEVWIVRTGTANTASVIAGIERTGRKARMIQKPEQVWSVDHLVLPGVGALAAAMQKLREDDMIDALKKRVQAGKPTLAICLGLQLFCEGSQEAPDVPALGIISGRVKRYPDTVRVPQLGWNRVEPDQQCRLLKPGYAYFANSYRLVSTPLGWTAGYADYAGKFVAALEQGQVLACQFHPELSGQWGQELLRRWLGGQATQGAQSC